MKIAFVNHPIAFPVPPERGAVQIWAHAIATRIVGSHDVAVYSLRAGFPENERCEGVLYRRVSLPKWAPRWKSILSRSPLLWKIDSSSVESRWHQWEYALAVARDLRAQKCDLVHIMNLLHLVPAIRCLNPRVKIVLHMHCQWLTRLDRAMVSARLANVDLIFGCSGFITETVRRAFPRFAGRCRTISNGVDPNIFSPSSPRGNPSEAGMRILWTGRISPEKGLHILLDAFARVLGRFPDAQLEIVGPEEQLPFKLLLNCDAADTITPLAEFDDGKSYLSHLQERATSLGIAERVTFRGLIPHDRLVECYRRAVLVVNPSLSETFGMSLIEAMSCGLPVVAARAGGMTEVVSDGECGFLVEPGNAAVLASALVRLLENDSLRNSMGEAGRRRVLKHFSWDRVAEAAVTEYREVLDGSAEVWPRLPDGAIQTALAMNNAERESLIHPSA